MSDNKKYYYLKLKEDFFDSEEMKVLESMKNGVEYQNVYLKMCLLSLKSDGALMFKNMIPYSLEMLSSVLRVNIDTIKTAIEIFKQMELITITDTETIYMSDIQALVGQSSTEAERIKKYRQSLKAKEVENVLPEPTECTNVVQMYEKCTPENRDKSIENRDKSINSKSHSSSKRRSADTFPNSDYEKAKNVYWENCGLLYVEGKLPVQKPVLSKYIKQTLKSAFNNYGVEAVINAIKESINHQWLVEQGYPLSYILGPNELPNLINKTYKNNQTYKTSNKQSNTFYKNFDKEALKDKDFFSDLEEFRNGTTN